jgi:hypothetical protein
MYLRSTAHHDTYFQLDISANDFEIRVVQNPNCIVWCAVDQQDTFGTNIVRLYEWTLPNAMPTFVIHDRFSLYPFGRILQSTARQAIQNCHISPVDFRPYAINHKAQIRLVIFQLVLPVKLLSVPISICFFVEDSVRSSIAPRLVRSACDRGS